MPPTTPPEEWPLEALAAKMRQYCYLLSELDADTLKQAANGDYDQLRKVRGWGSGDVSVSQLPPIVPQPWALWEVGPWYLGLGFGRSATELWAGRHPPPLPSTRKQQGTSLRFLDLFFWTLAPWALPECSTCASGVWPLSFSHFFLPCALPWLQYLRQRGVDAFYQKVAEVEAAEAGLMQVRAWWYGWCLCP